MSFFKRTSRILKELWVYRGAFSEEALKHTMSHLDPFIAEVNKRIKVLSFEIANVEKEKEEIDRLRDALNSARGDLIYISKLIEIIKERLSSWEKKKDKNSISEAERYMGELHGILESLEGDFNITKRKIAELRKDHTLLQKEEHELEK